MANDHPRFEDENDSREHLPSPRLGFARWKDIEDRESQAAAPDGRAPRFAGAHRYGTGAGGSAGGRVTFGAPGAHAGRGPLGYQRSDARIYEDVCERLTEAGDVDATNIAVTVDGGVVILSGEAHDRASRRRAEDIAGGASGVVDVLNRVRVPDAPLNR